MADEFKLDTKKLDALVKAFKGKIPKARVGVLSSKASRSGKDANNNASIGAIHEFGIGMPQRSFLRIPIADNLMKYLERSGAFKKTAVSEVIKTKQLGTFMAKIGVVAETVVLDAFASGGFGKWKPSQMRYKKVKQTLVETQQLRNSISSEVVDG